jgi:hypothetical protein
MTKPERNPNAEARNVIIGSETVWPSDFWLRTSFVIRHSDFSFVRLAAMDPLIGPAERAQPGFDALHQPEGEPALLPAGAPTDRAICANSGQRRVNPGFYPGRHFIPVCLWCYYAPSL